MIFDTAQVHLIVTGRKTQVRHPVGDVPLIGAPFNPGRRITVRRRGAPAGSDPTGHIIVTACAPQRLGDITPQQAAAEGHRSTAAFKIWWIDTHDTAWADRHADDDLRLAAFLARFDQKHADRTVWAITFAFDQDHGRFLHRDPARPPTTVLAQAAAGEPEMVDEARQQRITREAHDRDRDERRGTVNEQCARIEQAIASIEADVIVTKDAYRLLGELRRNLDRLRRIAA